MALGKFSLNVPNFPKNYTPKSDILGYKQKRSYGKLPCISRQSQIFFHKNYCPRKIFFLSFNYFFEILKTISWNLTSQNWDFELKKETGWERLFCWSGHTHLHWKFLVLTNGKLRIFWPISLKFCFFVAKTILPNLRFWFSATK